MNVFGSKKGKSYTIASEIKLLEASTYHQFNRFLAVILSNKLYHLLSFISF